MVILDNFLVYFPGSRFGLIHSILVTETQLLKDTAEVIPVTGTLHDLITASHYLTLCEVHSLLQA